MQNIFERTHFLCKPDTSIWSALPLMPKSSDLEASRRALCRSVKNFLDKAGNIYYLQWMDDHAYLRTMIQEGKDGLEWYRCKRSSILPQSSVPPRTVDPAKMQTVEAMIKAPDHREKMPHIIKTILEFAFLTYSGSSDQWLTSFYWMIILITDLPKGPIKGNSMRKLAAKVIKILVKTKPFFVTSVILFFPDFTRNPASPTPGPGAEAPRGGRALARLNHHSLPPLLLLPASWGRGITLDLDQQPDPFLYCEKLGLIFKIWCLWILKVLFMCSSIMVYIRDIFTKELSQHVPALQFSAWHTYMWSQQKGLLKY